MATLLDGVTGTGAGAEVAGSKVAPGGASHRGVPNNFSVVIVYATAAPDAATTVLQGSHDGSNWVDLGNTTEIGTTVEGFAVANMPFPKLRGNLTAYTAGSCTGVTMTCVGGN